MIKQLINNEWVVVEHPTDNAAEYRFYYSDTGWYSWQIPQESTPLIPIVITGVTGAIEHNSAFTDITCYELTDVHVMGTLEAPDQFFRMPIRRNDGKETIFIVELINGQFDAVLNFPTSGVYEYTNEQANARFAEPMFNVEPISITVARKAGEV